MSFLLPHVAMKGLVCVIVFSVTPLIVYTSVVLVYYLCVTIVLIYTLLRIECSLSICSSYGGCRKRRAYKLMLELLESRYVLPYGNTQGNCALVSCIVL